MIYEMQPIKIKYGGNLNEILHAARVVVALLIVGGHLIYSQRQESTENKIKAPTKNCLFNGKNGCRHRKSIEMCKAEWKFLRVAKTIVATAEAYEIYTWMNYARWYAMALHA